MFMFVDGLPFIATFDQVEQLFYEAFVNEFGSISITQWRASYEYQALYPAIQLMIENGAITQNSLSYIEDSILTLNEKIQLPAVLVSQVASRFKLENYEATIRQANISTKGIVAICVDYVSDAIQDRKICDLIALEMLPAGQFMEGNISLPYVFSNGQSFDIKWSTPTLINIEFKIDLIISNNSEYIVDDVDHIVDKFLKNFSDMAKVGMDITTEKYYEITRDAPWASSLYTTYSLDNGATWLDAIINVNYADKYIGTLKNSNVDIV